MNNFKLRCPICSSPLGVNENGKSLSCTGEKQHVYDISASGYVNLLAPGKMNNAKAGDSKEMLRARLSFLSGGYYDIISGEVARAISENLHREAITIIDAGCGEGYHLCKIAGQLNKNVQAIGFDASKHGADMGAKAARRIFSESKGVNAFFAAANIFDMPVVAGSADAVISMFAPIPAEEAARVLCDDGILIVASAGAKHLWEMRSIIYTEPRENDKGHAVPEGFYEVAKKSLSYQIKLDCPDDIQNLFTMTPFYHRCPADGRNCLLNTTKLALTVETDIYIYKKGTF